MQPTWPAPQAWQQALRTLITDPSELLELLELPATEAEVWTDAEFRLQVPRSFAARMQPGNRQDPLLLQVLPQRQEQLQVPGFGADPLAELTSNPRQGLVHKYHDRVLLIASGGCAINCRYCFRRHFPYQKNQLGPDQWREVMDYVSAQPQLHEVIFSGGDPLVTADNRLARMIEELASIPHLRRIRIHSRLPVVIPERVTQSLVQALSTTRLRPVLVLHCNHAQEINAEVEAAIRRLRDADITVLNQSVLLRGINDSVEAQQQLSETLFRSGVLPYYLFVLDPVAGAAHFDVPDAEARQLVGELQTRLPGYLVPRLAREIPGRPSKTLLLPAQSE